MPACAQCGEQNPPEARLCWSCGTTLPGRRRAGEERRVVTVLFVDLVDFTGLAEGLDPEDLKRIVTPYFARVRSELEWFGGTVEKYIGDAVMALFGAPTAYGDDAERAVRAALAIRRTIADLDEADSDLDLQVRIGVNTGEAFLDLAADPAAGEGMAAGDVVVTAFRLQQAAPAGGIVVGEGAQRATARVVEYVEVEPVSAEGKHAPLRAWSVVGLRDAAGRPRVELVGRDEELAGLRGILASSTPASAGFVTLVGPPGIGKSRLLWELRESVAGDPAPARWLQGRCLGYGSGVSFSALADVVKDQAGILESDPVAAVEAKLDAAVRAVFEDDPTCRWVKAYLRPLVGLGGVERLGGDRRAEAFSAWRRFVEALAAQVPLVLAFEDVHWADDGLLDFVEHLAEWLRGVPVAVLCTGRPELLERRSRWPGVIELEPLSTEDTGTLVDALLGSAPLPPELRQEVLVRSSGNPLYAEEFVRMLQERTGEDVGLPATVQATIAGRLDTLHPEAKELLRDAAVSGTGFWAGALAYMSGLRPEQVERRLGELQWKELVRPQPRSAVAGESQYAFWHVLVRDVAYAQIPRAARAERHRLAAEWIESLAAGRADLTELLAHHYTSALEYARLARQDTAALEERARQVLRDAGGHALSLYNFAAAVRFFREALALWPAGHPERARLLLDLGTSLFWAERGGDVELAEARAGLVEQRDPQRAAQADVLLSRLAHARGDRDAASAHAHGAVDLVRGSPPTREQAEAISNLAAFHAVWRESTQALEVSSRALELAEQLGLEEIKAEGLTFRGTARIFGGDNGGLDDLQQAVEIADGVSAKQLVRSCANLATSLVLLGELERAWAVYERGRAAAVRLGDAPGLHWLAAERVYEQYWRGSWDDALDGAEALLREADDGYGCYAARTVRARVGLARGDADGALEDARGAVEFARRARDPATLCEALALGSRVLATVGRREEAGALLDELLELSAAPGVLPSFWTADLAEALLELGRPDALPSPDGPATRWLEAARRLLAGACSDAADDYAAIGARPEEARARLRSAAATDLELACAFYREVGAGAYLRAAEGLLAAPA